MSFHLRPPSVDKGVSAFFWAFGFFLYLWLGMIAVVGMFDEAFRLYGEDRPTRA